MSASTFITRTQTARTMFVKIPFVYLMVCLGLLFDFLIGLPFLVICEITRRFGRD